jgi:hypothetical protein
MRDREAKRRETAAATGQCWLCTTPLAPALIKARYASHPACDPDEVSPLWPPLNWGRYG